MPVILHAVQTDASFAVGIVMANFSFGTLNEQESCNSIMHMIRVQLLGVYGILLNHLRCLLVVGMELSRCGSKNSFMTSYFQLSYTHSVMTDIVHLTVYLHLLQAGRASGCSFNHFGL